MTSEMMNFDVQKYKKTAERIAGNSAHSVNGSLLLYRGLETMMCTQFYASSGVYLIIAFLCLK